MSAQQPQVDQDVLYQLLCNWAQSLPSKQIGTYTRLSQEYYAQTKVWIDPHYGWSAPLGELNNHLHVKLPGSPPLSALVYNESENEPGPGFWGSAPNVPPRPAQMQQAQAIWQGIVKQVINFTWPARRP